METKTAAKIPYSPFRERTSSCLQQLLDTLWRFIRNGNFQIGDRLPSERAMAEALGISRTSLRKAIQVLAARGLLESRHGDGTYLRQTPDVVTTLPADTGDLDAFADILEAREILEPAIAELACLRHTQEQLDQLKIITCDQQRRLLTGQDDGELDAAFHTALARCSGNAALVELMDDINTRYRHCRAPELRDREWRQFSVDTHLRIIDALERRSIAECRAAVLEHLRAVRQTHPYIVQNL